MNPDKIKKLKQNLGHLRNFLESEGIEFWTDYKKGSRGYTEGYTRCLQCGKKTLITHEDQEISHCVDESCGFVADHIEFYEKLRGMSFRQAVYALCPKAGMQYGEMFKNQ